MIQSNPSKGDDETLDSFFHGHIRVTQRKKGYRFSVNAPLLADFIQTKKNDELLELGTGNGIISLLLSIKPFKHITAIEIQDSLFDLAQRNVRLNNLEDRIKVIKMDLKEYNPDRKFDVIFSNPPYYARNQGHLSASEESAVAKHELRCDVFDIMRKTSDLLKKDGRAYFVFPERRKKDFVKAVESHRMKFRTERSVNAYAGSTPIFFLAECDFSSSSKVVLPDLILYDEGGNYTRETQEIFAGRRYAATSDKI